MTIDVYSMTGTKGKTATLPSSLFEAAVNEGLIHQAVVRQQSNARSPIAHTKSRGEVQGSTRKLFQQKGTGRARRGSIRSPLLRGGGKAFGPKSVASYVKDMPRKMRRNALFGCLSLQAKHGSIIGLEGTSDKISTKTMNALLQKLPVELGRKILIVVPGQSTEIMLSARNIPGVKVIQARYLNPVDVLGAKNIIFHVDALKKAEEVFVGAAKEEETTEAPKKAPAKKATTKKSE